MSEYISAVESLFAMYFFVSSSEARGRTIPTGVGLSSVFLSVDTIVCTKSAA